MKIGILTLRLHSNYGGILQAYALQTVIERMGHDVVLFSKDDFKLSKKTKLKRFLKKILGRKVGPFYEKESLIMNKDILAFRKKYIHEVFIRRLKDINHFNLDCIVVGSDQVWRPKYFKEQWHEKMSNAFLSFMVGRKINRIAYAASFGVDNWEFSSSETNEAKFAIKYFNAISVREKSSIMLIKKYLNVDAKLVLDPTLLLTKDDYLNLIVNLNAPPPINKTLLVCLLDTSSEKEQLVKIISEQKGLNPCMVNRSNLPHSTPIEQRINPSVEFWLRSFNDAEFVVTDSFHACIFSIIFNKPFVVIGNKDRGMERFHTLLSLFTLEKNLINSLDEFDINYSYDIPYTSNNVIADLKKESMKFLKNNLKYN